MCGAMRLTSMLFGLSFALSGCFGGYYSGAELYRLLNEPLHDYYYGTDGSRTDDDLDFIYGWDVGP